MFGIASLYKKPSADTIAKEELEDAQRSLLIHQSAAEYNSQMAEYFQGVITRLEKRLNIPSSK